MSVRARLYDLQLPLERESLEAAAALAEPAAGERVLDLATGSGAMLRALSRRQSGLAALVGVDRSPAMLAGAQLPAHATTELADAGALPFGDQSFDVVTAAYVLHLCGAPERARILAEAARVLAIRGRLVCVTVWAGRRATDALLRRLPRASGLRPLDPRPELAAAGLRPVRALALNHGWPALVVRAERAADTATAANSGR